MYFMILNFILSGINFILFLDDLVKGHYGTAAVALLLAVLFIAIGKIQLHTYVKEQSDRSGK